MSRKVMVGVLWASDGDWPVPIHFTWARKLRGPRWRKLRRQLRRSQP